MAAKRTKAAAISPPAEAATAQTGMLLTATEFATFCKVSAGLVTSWCDEGMPCDRKARMGSRVSINLRDAVPWIVQKRSARSTVERDRVAAAQAERLEMANAKERRELIDAGELQNDLLKAISYLAQDLDSVGQRVTTDEAIQAKVEDELRIARNRFAEHLKAIAGKEETAAAIAGTSRKVAARRRKNPQARKAHAGAVGGPNTGTSSRNAGAGTVPQ